MSRFVKNDYGETPVVCGDEIFIAVGKMPFIQIISLEELKSPAQDLVERENPFRLHDLTDQVLPRVFEIHHSLALCMMCYSSTAQEINPSPLLRYKMLSGPYGSP
jgi:hypothetical protein